MGDAKSPTFLGNLLAVVRVPEGPRERKGEGGVGEVDQAGGSEG